MEYDKRPPLPNSRRVALHRDTALFFGAPDLDADYNHLRAKTIDVNEPKIAPYRTKQLFLRDPAGFGLCFQWKAMDRPSSMIFKA